MRGSSGQKETWARWMSWPGGWIGRRSGGRQGVDRRRVWAGVGVGGDRQVGEGRGAGGRACRSA